MLLEVRSRLNLTQVFDEAGTPREIDVRMVLAASQPVACEPEGTYTRYTAAGMAPMQVEGSPTQPLGSRHGDFRGRGQPLALTKAQPPLPTSSAQPPSFGWTPCLGLDSMTPSRFPSITSQECQQMAKLYHVVPGSSWGGLPAPLEPRWQQLQCDTHVLPQRQQRQKPFNFRALQRRSKN